MRVDAFPGAKAALNSTRVAEDARSHQKGSTALGLVFAVSAGLFCRTECEWLTSALPGKQTSSNDNPAGLIADSGTIASPGATPACGK